MGADITICTNVIDNFFYKNKNSNIKLISYQGYHPVNYVARYTDAAYTRWEAEGLEGVDYAKMKPCTSYVQYAFNQNNDIIGIKTRPNEELPNEVLILEGPGYS
jgi:hypothetical protein